MARSDNSPTLRIGIMGGTFDPIHIGHLIVAEEAWQQFGLDVVLFVPAGDPPHKSGRVVARGEDRLEMVKLAVNDNEHFEYSTVELDRVGPSYTVDTIRELRELLGESTQIYLLIGTDEARDLMTWHEPRGILELATIVVADRPNYTFESAVRRLPEDFASALVRLRVPRVDISSTDIRRRVRANLSIRYLVPRDVENYILDKGLYGS
ncbi:MAG: nicotinate-nucleotide adenylyltransferase [Armatimonadota bacterium]|nr:nicotinate-nucleotide adenylyltransferase [Armatimonadota bacterium]